MEPKPAILIVDDDVNLSSNLQHVLEVEGYSAMVATDAQSALKLSQEKVFDLVIVDIKLPDMPGLELIDKLTELSPQLEYIIITGYASLETAVEAVERKRVVTYVTKPLNMDYLLSLIAQVVERKQAEEMFRTISSSSPIGMYIVQDEKLQYVNPQLLKLTGYSEDETLGRESLEFVLAEDRAMARENVIKMLKGERSLPYEYRLITKEGKVRWVMETVTPIQYRGRRATLGNFLDITEHKQAERALTAQKELTDRVLASTLNAVLVIDSDLRVILVNRAFCETVNRQRAEVEGKSIDDVLPIAGLVETVSETLASRKPQLALEFQYTTKRGELILVAHIAPMEKEEVLIILQDVTAERTRQEQLYHINRLASIGEVAAGIAHELNNPLSSVLGYSELLLSQQVSEEVKKDVEVIHNNAQRAAIIVRNLLAFARRQPLQKRYLNVNNLVQHVLEMRGYELRVNNVEVITELADELPSVMADPQQLEQVFLNIILNAEQAMLEAHNRGTLTVRTEAKKGMVRIAFADDGPGILQENLRRVFDPFFTTRAPGKGTGLGLSICYGIVTEQGGRIYAESKLGEGATFFVDLPLAEEGGKT